MTKTRVADVMTTDVAAVEAGTGFLEIVRTMAERRVSALPVLDADRRVIGVVSEADLLHKEEFKQVPEPVRSIFEGRTARRARTLAKGSTAEELMSRPAVTVAPETTVVEAARLIDERGVKRLPVVENGRLVGIVSRADLLRVFLRSDAEIAAVVVDDVIRRNLWSDPDAVDVSVKDGVVTLSGQLELKSLIPVAVQLTAAVDGVIDVVDKLGYQRDDTTSRPSYFP